jgi:Tol biopolymer transport system component
MPDRHWNIYVVPASGGSPRALLPAEHDSADPEWSPDGHSLMFGRIPDYMGEAAAPRAIYTLNLDTNQVTTLPGSEDLYSPHWSPNGRYMVAMPTSGDRLMLFDFATQRWTKLIDSPLGIGTPRWSPIASTSISTVTSGMFWCGLAEVAASWKRFLISSPQKLMRQNVTLTT